MAGYVATWNLEAVEGRVEEQVARGLGRAAQYLAKRIKENIGRPGVKATTPFGSTTVMGKRVERGTPGGDIVRISRPGEFPRKRLGDLQSSIRGEQIDAKGLLYKVGSALAKAASIELGSRHMQPRPYLRATLAQERDELRAIFLGGAAQSRAGSASSELTAEDVERGEKNEFFESPPAMGEL